MASAKQLVHLPVVGSILDIRFIALDGRKVTFIDELRSQNNIAVGSVLRKSERITCVFAFIGSVVVAKEGWHGKVVVEACRRRSF